MHADFSYFEFDKDIITDNGRIYCAARRKESASL
jgi:hypothetical protein